MDWVNLAQVRNMWRDLVNAIMNLEVPQNAGISCLDKNRLATQAGLCFME